MAGVILQEGEDDFTHGTLPSPGEDRLPFFRRNNFELFICAVLRFFVEAPAAKLRGVTESIALHMIIRNFDHQLRTQRLPGQILTRTPAALAPWHAIIGLSVRLLRPIFPWMMGKRIFAIRCEKLYELTSFLFREARADTDMV